MLNRWKGRDTRDRTLELESKIRYLESKIGYLEKVLELAGFECCIDWRSYRIPVNCKDLKTKIELLEEYLGVDLRCTDPVPSKCRYVKVEENKDG